MYSEFAIFMNWVNSQQVQWQRDKNERELLTQQVNKIVKRFKEDELALMAMKDGKQFIFKTDGVEYRLSVYGTFDKPYFKGSEIASFLGYSRPRDAIRRHVKNKHKISVGELLENKGAPNQRSPFFGLEILKNMDKQTMLITEDALYRLVFDSELESAETFKDWVCEEVLPSIRKTGGYQHNFKINSNNFIDDFNHQNIWLLKD